MVFWQGAPRLPLRPLPRSARGVLLALILGAGAASAQSQTVCTAAAAVELCYRVLPGTPFYGHSVLGDTPEWSVLEMRRETGPVSWRPQGYPDGSLVFEDTAPRLADMDGDGSPEAVVVESSATLGARLAIYRLAPDPALLAATPYIGRRNRWLAPAGIADFNGDGLMDIAYVDRPHLARTLRIWTFEAGALREVAQAAGFSNHRIGDEFVTGGVRDCGTGPELVLADANWQSVMVARLEGDRITAAPVAGFSHGAVAAALDCQ